MTSSIIRFAGPLLVVGLLSACGRQAGSTSPPSVAVSTAQPVQQVFVHSVTAFGSAISNPRHARHLSVAHGGEVVAVMVSNGQAVDAGQTLLKFAVAPTARKAFKQAQGALALARDQLARNKKLMQQHLATQAQVDSARKAVSDAKAALQAQRQLGGGQPVDTITAPTAGVITRIQVTRGQRVPANTALATFTPAHGLIAQLGVQPYQATHIALGM
ncbi:MAG TPA: efflux RND transporter periplasmic adaptor subunit, partial [Oleiagrimonas sp.]|nr:efflux RND transporter periplasmic adaptor subunit [Oleiagrimonas sp.]